MNNFKERLSKAINSVFKELEDMSSIDFENELVQIQGDERRFAILYALHADSRDLRNSLGYTFNWKELLLDEAYNGKNIPSLFSDAPRINKALDDKTYEKFKISDDYFFKAAA